MNIGPFTRKIVVNAAKNMEKIYGLLTKSIPLFYVFKKGYETRETRRERRIKNEAGAQDQDQVPSAEEAGVTAQASSAQPGSTSSRIENTDNEIRERIIAYETQVLKNSPVPSPSQVNKKLSAGEERMAILLKVDQLMRDCEMDIDQLFRMCYSERSEQYDENQPPIRILETETVDSTTPDQFEANIIMIFDNTISTIQEEVNNIRAGFTDIDK